MRSIGKAIVVLLAVGMLSAGCGIIGGDAEVEPHTHPPGTGPHSHDGTMADGSMTHMPVEAPEGMSVSLQVIADTVSGYNLRIVTEGFRFAPESAGGAHVPGEGHAHLYVNGVKTRVYSEWFHLDGLAPGTHEVRVTLNANDHSPYATGGVMLEDGLSLQVAGQGG